MIHYQINITASATTAQQLIYLHWILYGDGSKPCTPGEHQNSW